MANTYGALKRVRQTERRTEFNRFAKTRLRHQIRAMRHTLAAKAPSVAASGVGFLLPSAREQARVAALLLSDCSLRQQHRQSRYPRALFHAWLRTPAAIRARDRIQKSDASLETFTIRCSSGLGEQSEHSWFGPRTAPAVRPAAVTVLYSFPVCHRDPSLSAGSA